MVRGNTCYLVIPAFVLALAIGAKGTIALRDARAIKEEARALNHFSLMLYQQHKADAVTLEMLKARFKGVDVTEDVTGPISGSQR